MKEIWKDIEGFEGLYQVSNMGNIMGLDRQVRMGRYGGFRTIKQHLLKIRDYPNGYSYVKLQLPKQENPKLVHRLIAKAFIPNPENKPDVNHKNGNKKDNRIENLEWCTKSENVFHAIINGFIKTGSESPMCRFRGEKHHASKKVRCATFGIDFPSIKIAADELGVSRLSIGLACNGFRTHVQGLSFRFL